MDWVSPTVREITHLLAGNKKFTKINGTSSYLSIVLDYEPSKHHQKGTGLYAFPGAYHVPTLSSNG